MSKQEQAFPDDATAGPRIGDRSADNADMSSRRDDTTLAEPVCDHSADEPLIDTRALAEWLGVSEHTVRKWVSKGPEAGLLPRTLRINGQIRFRRADVRDWLDSRVVA